MLLMRKPFIRPYGPFDEQYESIYLGRWMRPIVTEFNGFKP